MKKIWPLLVVGIFVLSGLGAAVAQEEETNLEKYEKILISQPILKDENEYVTVALEEGNSFLMKQGKPMLPIYIHTFKFPFGTQIKDVICTPKNIQMQKLSKDIIPAPKRAVVGMQVNTKEEIIDYGTEPYPGKWFEYEVRCGLDGKERVVFVKVEVYPINYQPIEKSIEWANEFDIKVEYEAPTEPLNFNEDYALVIIAPSDYTSKLNPLVSHKNGRGITTKLVTLTEIYSGTYFPVQGRDNQEKIKYFIKDAIENWGTSSVMLVGGSTKFPTRSTHVFIESDPIYGDEVFISDLYYADIYDDGGFCSWDSNGNNVFGEYDWGASHNYDDVDLIPDVFLGRLACVNTGEVDTAVDKIITYENNEAYTQNWFTDLIVVGGDSFPGDTHEVDEGEYVNQYIIDIMTGFYANKLWASEGDLGGTIPSGAQKISSAINDGCGFIDFSGHGNTNVWATHPHEDENTWLPTPFGYYVNIPHISSLSNGDKLPIVIVGACSTSKFNVDADCFNWMFIKNSNGGGIATLGATAIGYGYIGSYVVQGLIEGISINTFEAYKDLGALTFGEMWGKAIEEYVNTHTMDDGDHKTVEEWQPLGDPTLAIGEQSNPPETPDAPDGPRSGSVGQTLTYTASTTDPDGDEIYYMFDWGDGTKSGWVGPKTSGSTASADNSWSTQGTFEVKVVAKDDHGVLSDWSDSIEVSIPRNRALNRPFLRFLDNHPLLFPILRQLLQLLELY